MILLGVGAAMLLAAAILFKLALPQPNVAPATTFLGRTRLYGAYAIVLTALFGAGLVSSVFGLIYVF